MKGRVFSSPQQLALNSCFLHHFISNHMLKQTNASKRDLICNLSDGQRITGIIDGNFAYGDFLVDLATLYGTMGELNVVQAYQDYHLTSRKD
jgi:hypothetical protein